MGNHSDMDADTDVEAGADSDSTAARASEWDSLRAKYLKPAESRPTSTAQGVHHVALICTDVAATIEFYQGLLGFPLTELFENRDYPGSTHFFFDIGHGNLLAFFDFPDLGLGEYAEVLGGLHHLAISVEPEKHADLRKRIEDAGIPIDFDFETSIYFQGPDGERIELIADELGVMYGTEVR